MDSNARSIMIPMAKAGGKQEQMRQEFSGGSNGIHFVAKEEAIRRQQ